MKRPVKATLRTLALIATLTTIAVSQPTGMRTDSREDCAVCHLEWIDAFDRPEAALLIDPPDKPVVASSETCLGCHDGSVADSRQRVWLEHGHKTGIRPPETMTIPEMLPLENGAIVCRTCHTAHARTGAEGVAEAVFLRVPGRTSELCKMCHTDKTTGPKLGTHPIGGMPWAIPEELIAAGAKAEADQRVIHCQVCHTPHGSEREHLLVMGVADNQLCLTCHKKLRPRMWHPQREGVHPDQPVVTSPVQIEATQRMGTRIGRENRLICLSCHRMHHGTSGRFMLASTLEDSTFCLQCHPEQKSLVDSIHDLRRSAPKAHNRLGMPADQSGPCGACHMFHNLAIRPNPTANDPIGVCASCHVGGGLAGNTAAMQDTHPMHMAVSGLARDTRLPLFDNDGEPSPTGVVACLTCHDPHEAAEPHFLRKTPDELCRTCHADPANRMADGPHGEECLTCHKMHSWRPGETLWAGEPTEHDDPADAVCMQCHDETSWARDEDRPEHAVLHPRTSSKDPDQRMRCGTCHDPHAGETANALLRHADAATPAAVCLECHPTVKPISTSMHSQQIMARATGTEEPSVCGPCHAVHATETATAEKLWAAPMAGEGTTAAERRCRGCHNVKGPARPPKNTFDHPRAPLQAFDWKSLKTADEPIPVVPNGQITCRTCHLPHGRPNVLPATATTTQRAAAKPMIRTGLAQRLCAKCHGYNATGMFLYYHHPDKRR